MTSFFLFAPLIALTLLSALSVSGMRKNLNTHLSQCLKEVTDLQIQQKRLSKSLLALNPKALSLRVARKNAEFALASAPIPLKPAAYAKLKAVKVKQALLRNVQISFLSKARMSIRLTKIKLRSKKYQTIKTPFKLGLSKTPFLSDSPSYKPKYNYEIIQSFKATRLINLTSGFPTILKVLFKGLDTKKRFLCGATLILKNGKPWKTKLILD